MFYFSFRMRKYLDARDDTCDQLDETTLSNSFLELGESRLPIVCLRPET